MRLITLCPYRYLLYLQSKTLQAIIKWTVVIYFVMTYSTTQPQKFKTHADQRMVPYKWNEKANLKDQLTAAPSHPTKYVHDTDISSAANLAVDCILMNINAQPTKYPWIHDYTSTLRNHTNSYSDHFQSYLHTHRLHPLMFSSGHESRSCSMFLSPVNRAR